MRRKSLWPSRSHICIYMTKYHYVSSHQNHVFWFHISKNTKKINNSKIKIGFGIRYLCLHKPLLVVGKSLDHRGSQTMHRDSHLWRWVVSATTLPTPILHMTLAQHRWDRSQTPCGAISTLGLSPGTRSKDNVLSMLPNPKFCTLPILQSLSCCFMLLSSVVL